MDQRTTLGSNQNFLQLLQDIMDEDKIAYLLFDCMGMERAEGRILEIAAKAIPAYILLENHQKVLIEEIIGVNGIFRDDFSEC